MPRALIGGPRPIARTGAAFVIMAAMSVAACDAGGDGGRDRPPNDAPTTTVSPTTSTRASTTTPIPTSIPPSIPSSTTIAGDPGRVGATMVWPDDFPDPYVLATGGAYLAFGTQAGLLQVQRLEADDPREWRDLGEALPATPTWAVPYSTWAPAVLERDGTFVMYYAALLAGTELHCIGIARAARPEGPYVDDSSAPALCPRDQGGAIDPSPFVDADGTAYLLWKNDGVTLRSESAIWSQPLGTDGRPVDVEPAPLIRTDQPWEYPHVEAPTMLRVDDTYWLAYSGNWWNQAAYGVGLARCTSPLGPCEKPFDRAVLATTPGREGPGGLEFFRDAGGQASVVFHAWTHEPGYPGDRAMWIAPVALVLPT